MTETSFQKVLATAVTPRIDERLLRKAVMRKPEQYSDFDQPNPYQDFVVRFRKNQETITFKFNVKRLAERLEIERANEARRRAGG